MAKDPKKLPHLFLGQRATPQKFTSVQEARGKGVPKRDPKTHGTRLLADYVQAVRYGADARKAANTKGLLIRFESKPEFNLKLQSLDFTRNGIELLAVTPTDLGEAATVYIPEGALKHFERAFEDYSSKTTEKGNPQQNALVAPIESVRAAVLDDLWTDADGLPPKGEVRRYELWLRRAEVDRFMDLAERHRIAVSTNRLTFVDRTVIVAECSLSTLANSFDLLDCIAEIRRPPVASSVFVDLDTQEQAQWAEDLLRRLKVPHGGAPRVCLLDTGVNRAHKLLAPLIGEQDIHSYDPRWSAADRDGHGTEMAGLALYGDLAAALAHPANVEVTHRLESVRIKPSPPDQNNPDHYGYITQESVFRAEATNPDVPRAVCMAVTDRSIIHRGTPTAWSAAIDQLAFGNADGNEPKRLIVLAAGNVHDAPSELVPSDYPGRNHTTSIHDPAQAWNALTIGAMSDRDVIHRAGWSAIAKRGSLHPHSSTSMVWPSKWPLKPDVVMAGGNLAHDGAGHADADTNLQLLTTSHRFSMGRLFTTAGDTSAAAALGARAAASLLARYPNAWPETVRGLLVHTAEWTPEMLTEFGPLDKREKARNLISVYGFGACDLNRAHWSANNALTLIAQEEIQPYEHSGRPKSRDMHLHELPWPRDVLQSLGQIEVRMRVTLSYFIEPHPARKGFRERHRYASHALRFEVKAPTESLMQFQKRVNRAAREEEEGKPPSGDHSNWVLGPRERTRGSIHSDIWRGTAAELADQGVISVFPAIGWWRTHAKGAGYFDRKARYSLLVSIETAEQTVDLYTPVENLLQVSIDV